MKIKLSSYFRIASINLLFFSFTFHSKAQKDSTSSDSARQLEEVVVTGFQSNNPKSTSINIESYSLGLLNEKAPFNLSDALSKLPGVSQITTGNAISKPVIRGLYGNRILVLLGGLRFDNQQWQDEHGLGLSQCGIERIELIKGPASLLYGSDAMGGVINIIEEMPKSEKVLIDAGTQIFSNTLGTLTDIGLSKKRSNHWLRLRIGAENHADYSDGNNQRILNSRNKGYLFKAGYGFEKARWHQENSYNFSYNQFGFILNDQPDFFTPDDRWSRQMSGPHHNVMLNLFNSQNTFFLKSSLLKLNAGFQSNLRMEDEGGGQISLNMHLISALQNLKWEKHFSEHASLVVNQQLSFINNTNYGARILIPDANMIEGNFAGYFKFRFSKLILEAGAGGNYKMIHTFLTGNLNSPSEEINPFLKNDITGNTMLGFAYNPFEKITIKGNSSSGFRSPNLAELSANGLHEGVFRYEVGDPSLKVEQNLNNDISVEYSSEQLLFSVSGYYNRFFNYVYLAPTTESFYGFPVFRYRQQDASIKGAEIFINYQPVFLQHIQLKESLALIEGDLGQSDYLPFIPANKISSALRFEKVNGSKTFYTEPEFVYAFKQDKPGQFETVTKSYYLINFSAGITLPAKKGIWNLGFNVTNITNEKYADHLSRLKYYGLLNQGINFVLSARKQF